MNKAKESYDRIKPLIRPNKNFVFRKKKYPIVFIMKESIIKI